MKPKREDVILARTHRPITRHPHPEAPMPHGKIYPDVSETVGNTPLIRLNRIAAGLPATVVVKHEGYNPFDSVKDRIGAAMINDAVEKGRLIMSRIILVRLIMSRMIVSQESLRDGSLCSSVK